MTPVLPADPIAVPAAGPHSVDLVAADSGAADSPAGEGAELAALLRGVGVARLDDTGWIRATGEDRVRWLNGMVTNSIQSLGPGEGCYNFVLSAQGRIQGDLTAFAEEDALLLETDRARLPALMALFDRFIIMDDVELADVSASFGGVAIVGPGAEALLAKIGLAAEGVAPMTRVSVEAGGSPVTLLHPYSPLVPRFEIWTAPAAVEALFGSLVTAGAVACSAASVNALRVLEGTPRYGVDIRDKELAQETGQVRALHFAKGCYLGQEIVERVRSRGNVHRTFSGFVLEGELPGAGAVLDAEGKAVGELTSVVAIPAGVGLGDGLQVGLGYVRREAVERGLPVTYAGGTARAVALPYAIA